MSDSSDPMAKSESRRTELLSERLELRDAEIVRLQGGEPGPFLNCPLYPDRCSRLSNRNAADKKSSAPAWKDLRRRPRSLLPKPGQIVPLEL
jgi:hypothetical protein